MEPDPEGAILRPPARPPLGGAEPFQGVDGTVLDFWRFAMSDLRMNNTRGYLAEFLVAKAVGATGLRVEWDEFDVLSPAGVRIEVKSAAYLQNWEQRTLSPIRFGGLSRRGAQAPGVETGPRSFHADVYVFALQTAKIHDQYDPLDAEQWAFYVLGREAVTVLGQRSVGLVTLTRLSGGPVSYDELATVISGACGR